MGATIFGRKHNQVCCCGGVVICCDRCLPKDCFTGLPVDPIECPNALPMTLAVDLTATASSGSDTCFDGSGTLTFLTPLDEGGLCCWEGRISGTCTNCNGETYTWYIDMVVCCGEDGWIVSATPSSPCVMGIGGVTVVPSPCNPVLMSGCFDEEIVGCVVSCIGSMPPTAGPSYVLCFEVYETP